jgi:hypothetical protein
MTNNKQQTPHGFCETPEQKWPTHCEHDVLYVCHVDEEDVSAEDIARLDELGFFPNEEGGFQSFRFGSC